MPLVCNPAKSRMLLAYAGVFCCGAAAMFGIVALVPQNAGCSRTYDLLSPQVRCEQGLQQGEWDYEPLRDALLQKKAQFKNEGKASELSIAFRDLDNGARFGIGEYEKFQPASLRKVPILLVYLHMADLDPAILDKTLSFSGTLKMNANVEQSDETIQPNTPYTVRELLEKMIVYSDNYSYTVLTDELNQSPPILPYYTFRDLGVLKMMIDPKGEYISIQSYSTLFAILYSSGYLSKDMSQYGLNLLSRATFTEGLVAGVPAGTRVAHKFGLRAPEAGEDGQLHDCGIVYHPRTAYVLCVMTSGTDVEKQKQVIAEISHTVYEAVSSLSQDMRPRDDAGAPR
ncbi:MAG TPA: class A beta-lactamase-related serine hydrolase [Candidatus Peribacteria bacterium]|nr:class A beta-lactamase-related serine hydrolase [Candidatus Peribacteria bacterium]